MDLQEQVKDWKESNAMSEISEPIRALYELMAGNVCLCGGKEGRQGASIENRVTTFIISQRFALNWKQAFGLRLWYGATATDDISGAVDAFSADIELGREPRPQPWYIHDGVANSWKDSDQAEGEDEMWSLLQLYANKDTDPSSALDPRNVSLTPFDSRLSWQLGQALVATGKFSLPQHKADAATLALAEQLTAEGHWVLAIWALSHLVSPGGRARAVQAHLARYAGRLCRQPAAWKELRAQAWLPRGWAYEALALYVRAVEGDGVMELELLRKAGNYREAHRALVTKVGPQAVIDRDYGLLRLADALARHTVEIPEWGLGGALYAAYRQFWLSVQQGGKGGKGKGAGVRLDLVDRLLEMLRELKRQDANMEIAQRAALHLMSVQLAEVRQDVVGA
jgi:nuclear pore complex protein Nup98-Nup96